MIALGSPDTATDTYPRTVLTYQTGMPLHNGSSLAVGDDLVETFGAVAIDGAVADLSPSNDGLDVSAKGPASFCAYGCVLSENGVCNDPTDCILGTDCTDCGPYVLDGTATQTLRLLAEGRLAFAIEILGGSEQETVQFRVACNSDLAP